MNKFRNVTRTDSTPIDLSKLTVAHVSKSSFPESFHNTRSSPVNTSPLIVSPNGNQVYLTIADTELLEVSTPISSPPVDTLSKRKVSKDEIDQDSRTPLNSLNAFCHRKRQRVETKSHINKETSPEIITDTGVVTNDDKTYSRIIHASSRMEGGTRIIEPQLEANSPTHEQSVFDTPSTSTWETFYGVATRLDDNSSQDLRKARNIPVNNNANASNKGGSEMLEGQRVGGNPQRGGESTPKRLKHDHLTTPAWESQDGVANLAENCSPYHQQQQTRNKSNDINTNASIQFGCRKLDHPYLRGDGSEITKMPIRIGFGFTDNDNPFKIQGMATQERYENELKLRKSPNKHRVVTIRDGFDVMQPSTSRAHEYLNCDFADDEAPETKKTDVQLNVSHGVLHSGIFDTADPLPSTSYDYISITAEPMGSTSIGSDDFDPYYGVLKNGLRKTTDPVPSISYDYISSTIAEPMESAKIRCDYVDPHYSVLQNGLHKTGDPMLSTSLGQNGRVTSKIATIAEIHDVPRDVIDTRGSVPSSSPCRGDRKNVFTADRIHNRNNHSNHDANRMIPLTPDNKDPKQPQFVTVGSNTDISISNCSEELSSTTSPVRIRLLSHERSVEESERRTRRMAPLGLNSALFASENVPSASHSVEVLLNNHDVVIDENNNRNDNDASVVFLGGNNVRNKTDPSGVFLGGNNVRNDTDASDVVPSYFRQFVELISEML